MKSTDPKVKKPTAVQIKKEKLREQWIKDALALVRRLPEWNDTFKGMPEILAVVSEKGAALRPENINPAFLNWAMEKAVEIQKEQWEEMFAV